MTMTVEIVKGEAAWTLKLAGAADIFEAAALHQAAQEVLEGAPGPVVVSLRDVDAVDTSTTQVLLALRRDLAATGREVRFEGVRPEVAESWRRLGVERERG